ncbi:MAG: preprotein translocase subunit TatC [Verrucomicrobia bacterium]|nr:preprotein translocase subunit TatC [Verrucomicrobiota bacterium]
MSREPEGYPPSHISEEEEGGGPVKSFLEHLEDLRWTLVKCLVATLVSMLVAMIASSHIIAVLKWPLTHSLIRRAPDPNVVAVHMGTNLWGKMSAASLGVTNTATNKVISATLIPVQAGTNLLLSLRIDEKPYEITDVPQLKALGPMVPIMVGLKIALYGGLILAAPFLMLFIGQFVLPALHIHEKRILYQSVGFGIGLFILGVLFAYFVITGIALWAAVDFANWMGFAADEWRADEYIGFVTLFLLGMGACFEIPVVILVLVKIGLLDYRKLSAFRSYAIVGNLILGAVITPSGDPFTMLLFAAPLHLLYEISVVIAWFWDRRDRKQAMEAGVEERKSRR